MNKGKKLVLAVASLSCLSALLMGCGGESSGGGDDSLYICAYDGGYGSEWIQDMAEGFTKKTGIKVVADVSTTLLDRLEESLKNGGDYDLYMSHDINWQTYAAQGYLADLDDVYATEIDGYEGKTFKDRLVSGAADISKTAGLDGTEHYYKACYTQGAGGFIYNVDMFKENGWSVPTTYDELKTLCSTIVAAKVECGDREYVAPFAWSGADRQYYWDYPVFEWWAQLAGTDKIDTIKKYMGPTGKYADGYEMYNPETYDKEFIEAYDMWWNLIGNDSANSTSLAYSSTLVQAQSNFNTGKAAMIPYAQWGEYELTSTNGKDLDFDIAMMKTPKAKADSSYVNYMVGFGDSMIIPANAANISGAKQFLEYMATEEACHTFVKDAKGAFLAFDYTDVDLSDLEANSTYIKSIHEKLSDTNINLVSDNPITWWNTNKVMPWITNKYYYKTAAADPSNNTGAIIGAAMYSTAKSGWAGWLKNAGLSD